MPELEPSLNPDWDLNPHSRDSNPAKTHGLSTEITHLVSGLNEARFLKSHHRKNSMRDKMIGKIWIYLEKNTLHRQCWPSQKVKKSTGYGVVSFYRGG